MPWADENTGSWWQIRTTQVQIDSQHCHFQIISDKFPSIMPILYAEILNCCSKWKSNSTIAFHNWNYLCSRHNKNWHRVSILKIRHKMQHNCRSTLKTQILTCLKLKEFFLFNLLLVLTLYLFGILLNFCIFKLCFCCFRSPGFSVYILWDQLCVVSASQIISVVF